ncbi:LacI family DNA-binding transcriptional regulator [Mucilaginibacter gotjawali]|uniref:LacI family transcriptional regulator n=2 Tax=Mucilaginibacter gotjawali TaxID=1550579 RepID=A0A839SJF7_9SPHI|nr:LacI family DNA-binding transcriptional regulator [Mucilaginibacter gotjawali]MBB3056689.1 LacI family transcriptional regulator [Mucilaginibacter gotjawali]
MSEVTLKKLADLLNLSISTVSRALKDHEDISAETKNRVKELALILDYEPNTYAVNLRNNFSREFAVIIPSIANDFYQSFISSLEKEARLNSYSLIILQSGDDPQTELECVKRCKQNRVAGIFVSITQKTTDISHFLKLAESHIPVVFFDKVPASGFCNKVCVDDISAARLSAETLILKKKKGILAIFGNEQLSITQKRLDAFKDTFSLHNYDARPDIYHTNSSAGAYHYTMEQLALPQQPDVIFCMSDEILIGVMRAVQTVGLRPPADIGILAISEGQIPTFYFPQITYVETSGFKLAKLAFSRMLGCLAGSTQVQELKTESIIVEGGSL